VINLTAMRNVIQTPDPLQIGAEKWRMLCQKRPF